MATAEALLRVLRSFARTMAGSYDITDALHEMSDNAVEVLDAAGAGIGLCDDNQLRFVTATSEAAVTAERAQERLQAGPCYASLLERHPVPVTDIRDHHDEWPEFCAIVEEVGFMSVLGLPLVLADRRVGSLNIYDTAPRAWDEAAISTGTLLADIACAFILNASELAQSQRTAEQLQHALDSRVLIEQAKGRLVGELDMAPDAAFEVIRHHARSNHESVRDVSRRVIEGGAGVLDR